MKHKITEWLREKWHVWRGHDLTIYFYIIGDRMVVCSCGTSWVDDIPR